MNNFNKDSIGGFNFEGEEIFELFGMYPGIQIGFPTLYGINIIANNKPLEIEEDSRFSHHEVSVVILKECEDSRIKNRTLEVLDKMNFNISSNKIFQTDDILYIKVSPIELANIINFVSKLEVN